MALETSSCEPPVPTNRPEVGTCPESWCVRTPRSAQKRRGSWRSEFQRGKSTKAPRASTPTRWRFHRAEVRIATGLPESQQQGPLQWRQSPLQIRFPLKWRTASPRPSSSRAQGHLPLVRPWYGDGQRPNAFGSVRSNMSISRFIRDRRLNVVRLQRDGSGRPPCAALAQ